MFVIDSLFGRISRNYTSKRYVAFFEEAAFNGTRSREEKVQRRLLDWAQDMKNHWWFSCVSSKGDVAKLKMTWHSLLHHCAGDHEWPEDECRHNSTPDVILKPSIKRSSEAFVSLRGIVTNNKVLQQAHYYRNGRATGMIENFNSLVLKYASKRISFGYESMLTRIAIATIDHNHHIHVPNKTHDGNVAHRRLWCKSSGQWVVSPIKEEKDYAYVPYILAKILCDRTAEEIPLKTKIQFVPTPGHPKTIASTIAAVPPTPTSELVAKHVSRFTK